MIWLQQLLDEIESACLGTALDLNALSVAQQLSDLCDQHVPSAPKPKVELSPEDGLHISWHWQKKHRAFTMLVGRLHVQLIAVDSPPGLDGARTAHLYVPSDEQISKFMRSFFEGYDPQ